LGGRRWGKKKKEIISKKMSRKVEIKEKKITAMLRKVKERGRPTGRYAGGSGKLGNRNKKIKN